MSYVNPSHTSVKPKGNHIYKVMLAANSDALIFIEGEKGSGKEFSARMIHDQSHVIGDFVVVDCKSFSHMAIPNIFLDSAVGGTLFLRHVECLGYEAQAQVLGLFSSGRSPVESGVSHGKALDARIMVSSECSLDELINTGMFREDLMDRMKMYRVKLEPLRVRMADFKSLTDELLQRMQHVNAMGCMCLDDEAYVKLQSHTWDGNIKELELVLLRAAQNTRTGVITASKIHFI